MSRSLHWSAGTGWAELSSAKSSHNVGSHRRLFAFLFTNSTDNNGPGLIVKDTNTFCKHINVCYIFRNSAVFPWKNLSVPIKSSMQSHQQSARGRMPCNFHNILRPSDWLSRSLGIGHSRHVFHVPAEEWQSSFASTDLSSPTVFTIKTSTF